MTEKTKDIQKPCVLKNVVIVRSIFHQKESPEETV